LFIGSVSLASRAAEVWVARPTPRKQHGTCSRRSFCAPFAYDDLATVARLQ
jgi:hypothetical protein